MKKGDVVRWEISKGYFEEGRVNWVKDNHAGVTETKDKNAGAVILVSDATIVTEFSEDKLREGLPSLSEAELVNRIANLRGMKFPTKDKKRTKAGKISKTHVLSKVLKGLADAEDKGIDINELIAKVLGDKE